VTGVTFEVAGANLPTDRQRSFTIFPHSSRFSSARHSFSSSRDCCNRQGFAHSCRLPRIVRSQAL